MSTIYVECCGACLGNMRDEDQTWAGNMRVSVRSYGVVIASSWTYGSPTVISLFSHRYSNKESSREIDGAEGQRGRETQRHMTRRSHRGWSRRLGSCGTPSVNLVVDIFASMTIAIAQKRAVAKRFYHQSQGTNHKQYQVISVSVCLFGSVFTAG